VQLRPLLEEPDRRVLRGRTLICVRQAAVVKRAPIGRRAAPRLPNSHETMEFAEFADVAPAHYKAANFQRFAA
jgi:hypothetical protein